MTPNGAPTQPLLGLIQGGRNANKAMERMTVTLPWHPRDVAAQRPAVTDVGTMFNNNNTRSAGGRGGLATGGDGGAPRKR